jgi:hypothetical protein
MPETSITATLFIFDLRILYWRRDFNLPVPRCPFGIQCVGYFGWFSFSCMPMPRLLLIFFHLYSDYVWPFNSVYQLFSTDGNHIPFFYRFNMFLLHGPPLRSNNKSSWPQSQRSRVRFPALSDFLRSSWSGTQSIQHRHDNWGATWMKSNSFGL